jgi:hypothetical protein
MLLVKSRADTANDQKGCLWRRLLPVNAGHGSFQPEIDEGVRLPGEDLGSERLLPPFSHNCVKRQYRKVSKLPALEVCPARISGGMFHRRRFTDRYGCGVIFAGLLLTFLLCVRGAAAPDKFRFVLLGDRTGEAQQGVYEQVWKDVAARKPAFVVSVGDTIQGLNDKSADIEWRRIDQLLKPFRRYPVYFAPGNHDVWSAASERLFRQHTARGLHYSFDYGQAHFTILDNSRSEEFSAEELVFLEADLKAHAAQPLKFIVSHRPSWIVNVALQNPNFALHQLARQYGVQYVVAGHIHQMLHLELQGVTYISTPSAGGHLRLSGAYEDGWFFGHTLVEIRDKAIEFEIKELGPPRGKGRITRPADWGMVGLVQKHRPESAPAR